MYNNQFKFSINYNSNIDKSEFILEDLKPISDEFTVIDLIKDAKIQLDQLINKNIFDDFHVLKISGRLPLPIAYLLAHDLQHFFNVIAVYYPQKNIYVVTHSSNAHYQVGDSFSDGSDQKISVTSSEKEAFTTRVSGDILYVDCTLGIKDGDSLTREVEEKINQLIATKQLKGGKLLKINGKSSVLASFVIAHKVCHLYANVAVFDPKIDGYVTVTRHGGLYPIGHYLPENNNLHQHKKIVICGNANRGKTLIKDGLRMILSQYLRNEDYYLISGCPDGDGAWYSETCQNNSSLARRLKDQYKASFTPEFAKNKALEIKNIGTPLLIFDVGGKMNGSQLTPSNQIIMAEANCAVIVGGNEVEIAPWRNCCEELGLKVIAEITTKTEEGNDTFDVKNNVFSATIHQLGRGNNLTQSTGINKLAEYIAPGDNF
ncbi:MAG: hypothetical protein ACXITR_01245 [Cyanobacterium sp.]